MSDAIPAVAKARRVCGDTSIEINVYASENQDVNELAQIIMQNMRFEIEKRGAALDA